MWELNIHFYSLIGALMCARVCSIRNVIIACIGVCNVRKKKISIAIPRD